MRSREFFKRLHLLAKGLEECVSIRDPGDYCAATGDEVGSFRAWLTSNSPVGRESSIRGACHRRPQGLIPIGGPARNHQAKVVEYSIEQSVKCIRIRRQFFWRISNTRVEVVTVNFDNRARRVNKRKGALNLVWCTQDGRLNPNVLQSDFQESVEVGGQNHPDISQTDEFGDGAVSLGWKLDPFLSLLRGGLPIASEQLLALSWRLRNLVEQIRIIWLPAGFTQKPSSGVGFTVFRL